MAERSGRRKLDSFGRPLPSLVEVRQDYLGNHSPNQVQRERLAALIDEQWQLLLRRGFFGELAIVVTIVDGVLQDQTHVSVTRQLRSRKEGPDEHRA